MRAEACRERGSDAAHPLECLERTEGAVRESIVHDPLRQRRTDAGQFVERRRIGEVHVDGTAGCR